MKVVPATLKGLNVNMLKIQPFQGYEFCFFHFPPVSPAVIQILSLQDNIQLFEWTQR